jgi:hypothetical protein
MFMKVISRKVGQFPSVIEKVNEKLDFKGVPHIFRQLQELYI